MTDLTKLLDDPTTSFAIVGATDSPGKFGGIIYRDLRRKGWKVFAVNPLRSEVANDPCWASISDIPEVPTIAVLVVPARQGLQVMEDCAAAGVSNIWVQPGAHSPELEQALDSGGFHWLANACVMVEASEAV
jgi:predicted CoA-binding protein